MNKYTLSNRFLNGNVHGCVFAKNRPVSLNWPDYNKNKNIKYFVYSTSYSSLTHKQILKSDLQSDLPFVVGAQKNPLIKMVLLSTHNICFA